MTIAPGSDTADIVPMGAPLVPHPVGPRAPIDEIRARASLTQEGWLDCVFRIRGDLDQLRIPAQTTCAQRDGLWAHTCVEVFIGQTGASDYVEYNFAPSTAWNAYYFTNYRTAASPAPRVRIMAFDVRQTGNALTIRVQLTPPRPPLILTRDTPIGLSAVIETRDGQVSHWALHHPADAPDFHDPRAFTGRLHHAEPVS